jgi:hypothetical protein
MKEQLRMVIKLHEVNKLMTELLEAFEGLKVEGISDEEIELIMAEFRHITQGKEGIMEHVRHDLQNLYSGFMPATARMPSPRCRMIYARAAL